MGTIAVANDCTFKSTKVEQHLLEVINFLQVQENDTTKNPLGKNQVKGSFSIDSGIFSGDFELQATQTINSLGQLVLAITEDYLTNLVFTPGTNNIFKSDKATGYLLEVASHIQLLEADTTKNPNGINNVSIAYDADTKLISGTVTLPCTLSINPDGSIKFVAKEYLV